MELLSSEYGWLPSQIRQEKDSDIRKYVAIINEKRRIENKLNKQKS